MFKAELPPVDSSSGATAPCVVDVAKSGNRATLRLSVAGAEDLVAHGYDFEEALQTLRSLLEDRELLLLCNRYRRDAVITTMSRQMSDGLRCYIARPYRRLRIKSVVDCLGQSEPSAVVTSEEAAAFRERLEASYAAPMPVRWVRRWFR